MYEASGKLLRALMGLQALDQQACKQCSSDKGSTSCFTVQGEIQNSYSYQAQKVSLFPCPLPGLILGAWPSAFPGAFAVRSLGATSSGPCLGLTAVPLPADSPSASDTALLSVLPAPGLVKGCYRVECILHVSVFTSFVVLGAKKVLNTI